MHPNLKTKEMLSKGVSRGLVDSRYYLGTGACSLLFLDRTQNIWWPSSSTLGETWTAFQYSSILLKELNIDLAVAVDTQTAVSQHQLDNQPHLHPLETNPGLREQPVANRNIFTRSSNLVPPSLDLATSIDHHVRFEFWPNGLLQVQVSLILRRIIIRQLEVGPRLLPHPNLLPPEELDYALHWAQGCRCLIGTPTGGIRPKLPIETQHPYVITYFPSLWQPENCAHDPRILRHKWHAA